MASLSALGPVCLPSSPLLMWSNLRHCGFVYCFPSRHAVLGHNEVTGTRDSDCHATVPIPVPGLKVLQCFVENQPLKANSSKNRFREMLFSPLAQSSDYRNSRLVSWLVSQDDGFT